jgi:hypothetical protein
MTGLSEVGQGSSESGMACKARLLGIFASLTFQARPRRFRDAPQTT